MKPMFIELTNAYYGTKMMVNMDTVECFYPDDDGTMLELSNGELHKVRESYGEVVYKMIQEQGWSKQ